jgi:SAM-dependent methyltransferase
MTAPLIQHQTEIERNLLAWQRKPLLQQIYSGFYQRIVGLIDYSIPGQIVEIGSGIGSLKSHLPQALATDLFPNPWIDRVCDAYEMPFRDGTLSHLVMFDVFHHLSTPSAFFREARRVLAPSGRVILFEPYISGTSHLVYKFFHHEPVAWKEPINLATAVSRPLDYYAAQGNATRLFFRKEVPGWPEDWTLIHAKAFSCFHYLFSGGYSKPAMYPGALLRTFQKLDLNLSRWPRWFGGRCLIGLERL